MTLTTVKSENDIVEDIRNLLFGITSIMPDEIDKENTFRVWLGSDGYSSLAMGIEMDKVKYPSGYKYKAYVALLHNITVMMADYTNFLMWTIDLKHHGKEETPTL